MDFNIEHILSNLEKNNMDAFFVKSREHALSTVKQLIVPKSTVVFGGSETLKQCKITDMIEKGDYVVNSRSDLAKMFTSDYFLSGTNAITKDGILYNVDGVSNRIACMAHGPEKVIIVAGINKLVNNLDEAVKRVKHIAAPKNCERLKRDTHCAKNGKCISDDINEGCDSKDRICCNYLITAKQRQKGRITVIIVDEQLGY